MSAPIVYDAAATAVAELLESAGHRKLAPPISIGGIRFEVPNAFAGGPGSLDLTVIFDATVPSRATLSRIRWTVERMARALDTVGSRRALTMILIGSPRGEDLDQAELLPLGRVLVVDNASDIRRALAPLLPLEFPPSSVDASRPELTVAVSHHERDGRWLERLMTEAASPGDVEATLRAWLDDAFTNARLGGQSG